MIHSGQTGRIKFQVYLAWGERATLGCVKGLKSVCASIAAGPDELWVSDGTGKFHLFKI